MRRYVRTALAFLVLGTLIGLHASAAEYLGAGVPRHGYVVAHTHVLLVGFVLMLIMGVAAWMFPRAAEGDARYKPERIELAYWLITLGVALRSICEILREHLAWRWLGPGVFATSSAEVLALIVFALAILPRIRSPREEAARREPRAPS